MIKPDSMLSEFRRRFWLPPRAHGDVIEDRTVSSWATAAFATLLLLRILLGVFRSERQLDRN